jgi:hypothetical protein
MKSLFWATSGVLLFSTPALADPAALFGVTYNFQSESSFGLTVKLLSNDLPNNVVVGAGINYYPFAQSQNFGVDLSAGYVFQNVAVTGGYDFVRKEPQLAVGYVNTRSTSSAPSNVTTPPAPPTYTPPPPFVPQDTINGGAGR